MIVASDYDGTYDRMSDDEKNEIDFVITAEHWEDFPSIEADGNTNIPIFFNSNPQDLMNIVMHKSEIINKNNVDKYYDDDVTVVPFLVRLCPKTKIILYQERR